MRMYLLRVYVLQVCSFLYLCGSYVGFELSGISVREMSQFDAEALQTQLRNCELDNVGYADDACSKLEYVSRYVELREIVLRDSLEKVHRLHEVTFVDKSTDYQLMFENYVLKNR